jgi:hypothetical protein
MLFYYESLVLSISTLWADAQVPMNYLVIEKPSYFNVNTIFVCFKQIACTSCNWEVLRLSHVGLQLLSLVRSCGMRSGSFSSLSEKELCASMPVVSSLIGSQRFIYKCSNRCAIIARN